MKIKRAIIDLRSVLWTGLLVGKDQEFGRKVMFEDKEVHVNSASYGYDNVVDHLLLVLDELKIQPRDCIFVDEGRNSKMMREAMFAGYKSGRDQAPEIKEQFNLAKEMLVSAFLNVGAQMCWQEAMEADDVIAYLAKTLKGEQYVVTNDGDLVACINPDLGAHVYRQGRLDYNHYGPFDPKYVAVYKALIGDSSDKYPGAKGFGEKAFIKLLETFGEDALGFMEDLILRKKLVELGEDVAEMKELVKIIDGAEMVYTSYALAKLYTEKVNTMRRPIQWRVGMVRDISLCEDERLRKYHSQVRLIDANNYAEAMKWAAPHIKYSPYTTLDIETSTPEESDEWLSHLGKEATVDVFGSELTGLGMTFGANMQYTFYLTHDHLDDGSSPNLSVAQVRDFAGMVPEHKMTIVHNAQFELPVLFSEWGEDWKDDPVYHGFLRNVRDTRILSHYVDENRKHNLKSLSEEVLGYTQVTYDQVTTRTFLMGEEPVNKGKVIKTWIDEERDEDMIQVQFKMNELTAKRVLSYGADDCICTAALYNHFRVISELENSYHIFEEVETFPAYLTAKAFVDGADFSAEDMLKMEKDDDVAYDAAWAVLRQFLMEIEWDGSICPEFTEITNGSVKEMFTLLTGETLVTLVKKQDRLADVLIEAAESINDGGDSDLADKVEVLSVAVREGNLKVINELVKANFDGEPKLDLASPKQMKAFMYDTLKLPINIINDVTPLERQNKPDLAKAAQKFKRKKAGHDVTMEPEELDLLKAKAKTDDTAIAFAIAFDREFVCDRHVEVLEAVGTMKTAMTRRSLFYNNYRNLRHWKDSKIHAGINQCGTVTRRYSSSKPNLQQLPKKGEGVKFRECFKPHHRDAVICSIDFSGQELRLAAERSQDVNMLSCYIGENKRDIHSITASGAMKLKWGADLVKHLYGEYGEGCNSDYDLFIKVRGFGKSKPIGKQADDLRKDSKNVNFAAQFGGKAPKISETIVMPLEDAQLFLDARNEMFPDVDKAAEKAAQHCKNVGYAETFMGARRHLREGITSNDKGEVERAARQAWNMEIQGSAAEMTKLAMARFWLSDALWKYDVRFIAPIHDELVTSIARKDVLAVTKIKHECMVAPYSTMKVPVMGSISVGPNFGVQYECGDWYIPENIQRDLDKVFKAKEAA